MDFMQSLDPELWAFVAPRSPAGNLTAEGILARRDLKVGSTTIPLESVIIEDHLIPGPEGAPPVKVRIYTPKARTEPAKALPGLIWNPGAFHGFDRLVPQASVSQQALAEYTDALKRGL